MAAKRILLIANPASGRRRGERRLAQAEEHLASLGHTVTAELTESAGHATLLTKSNAPDFEIVAALGGDGTVNEVTNGLMAIEPGKRPALATLPVGTGNDVALTFGLAHFKTAIDALANGNTRTLDIIRVQLVRDGESVTRHALLFVAAGFAAEVIRKTGPRVKRIFGRRFSYSVGLFRALASFRAPEFTVKWNGQEKQEMMFQICAGNTEFAGGGVMRLSPSAQPDDGLLDISLVGALGRLQIVRRFPSILSGRYVEDKRVDYFTGKRLEIDAVPPAEIQADGDIIGTTPAAIELLPGALRLVTPE
ncbi:MAG: diacylglycerol kinase family lipid kinase [Verrucomicrobiota bacterium]|jgi:diacylglycerol kinase (ATP)|nr:diacylglycerol kinase family lipid kinase [Verrucomicrobiota bacterium]MDP6251344.1 diacylglycerol kinase family lipid kinase [Verrucomicrobiota bacterium]MDP7441908.1 diacylglycerol kinase family lipid kinase [Verrucomicrobiota bacterium]|tara:strand:- start:291 stop:1211 length:921 start_codon:yes stop_codon:yes gene_type:complete